MEIFIIIILLFLLASTIIYYRVQSTILHRGLDEFIQGKFFNVLCIQPGIYKGITSKINLIVHNLFLEKEEVEDLLQEQKLLRYEFTEFFLQAHSFYEAEKIYSLVVDSLYKMFHPEIISLVIMKPGAISDVYIKQLIEQSVPAMIVKESIKIEDIEQLNIPYLSNADCKNDCDIFVADLIKKVHNFLQIPIIVDKEFIGTIQIFNRNGGFDNNDKELVQTMAVFIANQLKIIQVLDEEQGAIEKYGSIINILSDGIIIFDENKNIIMENPSARDFFSLNQVKKQVLINDLLSNRKFSTINLVLFKPERLVLSGKIDELPELSNGLKTYILILRNITESKRKEREKSELFFLTATTMHNELGTLIRRHKANPETMSESVFKVINFSNLLLNKLIYHTQMDSGPLRLFKKPVLLSKLISELLEKRIPELNTSNIQVATKLIESEHRFFIDSDNIALSMNLLLDYILAKNTKLSSIYVESDFEEDYFVIKFLQQGIFYNTMDLYELTKASLQVERFMVSDVEIQDLNVELAYVKHILVSHGGDFIISNEHDGTKFSYLIPFHGEVNGK